MYYSGFLCGECPTGPGKGVDLTLLQCTDCSVRDTILVALVGMCVYLKHFETLGSCRSSVISVSPHSDLFCPGVCSYSYLQHWNT
jgi:hypothetical protein